MNKGLDRLKNMLSNIPEKDFDNYFRDIAEILMNQCYIQKGDTRYQIIEIEFYLFTQNHPDVITYPRETPAGMWFFHQSGVDLTFKSDRNVFGGILIRGLKNLVTGKIILGPLNCVNTLWDEFNAFNPDVREFPSILFSEAQFNYDISDTYKRWIPIKPDKVENKMADWIKRLPTPKSEIDYKEAESVVFDSRYRFIVKDVVDSEPKVWKSYSARPKNQTHV